MSNREVEPGASAVARMRTDPYGPRCTPLFYTALLAPPRFLTWDRIPNAALYRITLCPVASREDARPLWSTDAFLNGKAVWELPSLDLQPGVQYAWRVAPLGKYPVSEGLADSGSVSVQPLSFAMEARFWLIEPEALSRMKYSMLLLEGSSAPEFASLARAILLAQAGLFQEAIRLVHREKTNDQGSTRALLAETALSVIYRRMGQRLAAQTDVPACFAAWVRNREQQHRSRVQAHRLYASMMEPQKNSPKDRVYPVIAYPDPALALYANRG